jgi:hypothetical protein
MKTGATPGARPHPLLNWHTFYRPKDFGGQGVLDLDRFGRDMRLRFRWIALTDESKPCIGMIMHCDDADMDFFRASIEVTVGNEAKCLFDGWRSSQVSVAGPLCHCHEKEEDGEEGASLA